MLNARRLLLRHSATLATIRQLAGVPPAHWDSLYAPAFEAFAAFVQRLPASEAHHHAGPGGLLAHGLEVVREALKLRRGRLLPPGAGVEELAARHDLWTYATATGALLHDIGKPVTDQLVLLYDSDGRPLAPWDPWLGPMPATATWYRPTFVRDRRYRSHEQVAPLLVHFILPPPGLSWLASDPDVFSAWLAAITGDSGRAGVLGELIQQADGLSVANDLQGTPALLSAARRKPLSVRLLTGLRYLIDQGLLPLNRPGAAGWRVGDNLWLVSKRMLDALRDHLRQEGQEGVPSHNERLMDELQQHGLLIPNDGRAIWTVEIRTGDWTQRLTVLRFSVSLLWPQSDAGPPAFDGTVTPASPEGSRGKRKEEKEPAPAVAAITTDTDSDDNPDAEATSPEAAAHPSPAAPETGDDALTLSRPVSPASGSDNDDLGHRFLSWLKDGLRCGRLPINAVNARVHVVAEGLLLVSPGIFKDFDPDGWTRAQKRFLKLKLHRRTPQAANVWTYEVSGQRKKSRINGLLIGNPGEVLGLALPAPNPHLSLRA